MNKEEFRAFVYDAAPQSVSLTSLDVAIDFYIEWNLLDRRVPRECARECINLAMRIDIQCALNRSSQSGESPFQRMPLMPEDLVMSDDFAEKIRPAVEQLRNTLFGSPAPPFSVYEDATQWLEQTAAEQDAYAQANSQTRIAWERTIHDMLEKYRGLTGEDYHSPFLRNLLEYAKPGSDWVYRVIVWGGTSLATLANKSRTLVDATGFTQANVVAYVLAGIRPLLTPMSIDMSWGYSNEFNTSRRRATVEFRTSKVTDTHLRAIRKGLRSGWGTERKKPLTEEDKQLLDIVQRLGDVPNDKGHGEIKTFYEQVQQEFNACAVEHGYETHSTWKVTRLRHKRLWERMQQGGLYMQVASH